jgi:PIH1 CS-like domain
LFRQIQFSYLDLYTLSIPLPFPVFEKKGTAKFDKAAKTLTVTMPVQPSKPSDTEPAPAPSAVTVTANQDNDNDVDESVDEVSPVSADMKKEVKKEEIMKSGNSRWIGDEESRKEDSRKRNEELKQEIKTKSLPVPPSASVIPSTSTLPPAPPSLSVSVPNPPSSSTGNAGSSSSSITSSSAGVGSGFEPCNSFAGRREGYMFRRGDLGQGYYADVSFSPLPASVSTPVPSSGSLHPSASQPLSVHSSPQSSNPSTSAQSSTLKYTSKSCPMEHRQTKQAIAVLIQVPGILLDSATVSFNEYIVDVEFRALGSDSRMLSSESAHVNPIIATSASVALLTGNNTAINANSILDRTESSLTSIKDLSPDKIELTDLYGFRLTSVVRLSKNLCKYDIASKNMVLVLAKEEEGFHEESDDFKILSMVSCSTGQ